MKIGIVNDTQLHVDSLRWIVSHSRKHTVAWVARDGAEAVARCAADTPDLVLMDLNMPKLDGVEATRRIMAESPCAVLIVTATIEGNSAKIFEAMGAGALDAVQTPGQSRDNTATGGTALLAKIDTLGKLVGDRNGRHGRNLREVDTMFFSSRPSLVAIGSSAGGPGALARVLAELPVKTPAAVVIVQHVDAQFAAGLANWLCDSSRLPVRVAAPGDRPQPGTVLVAGTNDHLIMETSGRLAYTHEPAHFAYRPSVDVFFDSVVKHWKGDVTGVLLTGMGRDGAKGLHALRKAGHHTIAQDKETCAVYGMPKAAAELGAAVEIMPLEKIAPAILKQLNYKTKSP